MTRSLFVIVAHSVSSFYQDRSFCHNLNKRCTKSRSSAISQKFSKFEKQILSFLHLLLRSRRFCHDLNKRCIKSRSSSISQKFSKFEKQILSFLHLLLRSRRFCHDLNKRCIKSRSSSISQKFSKFEKQILSFLHLLLRSRRFCRDLNSCIAYYLQILNRRRIILYIKSILFLHHLVRLWLLERERRVTNEKTRFRPIISRYFISRVWK